MKVVTAAVFSSAMLKKRFTTAQVISLPMLSFGVALVNLSKGAAAAFACFYACWHVSA